MVPRGPPRRMPAALALVLVLALSIGHIPSGLADESVTTAFTLVYAPVAGLDDSHAIPITVSETAIILGWTVSGFLIYGLPVDDMALMMGVYTTQGNVITTVFWGPGERGAEVKAQGLSIKEVSRATGSVGWHITYTALFHIGLTPGTYWFVVAAPDASSIDLEVEMAYDYGAMTLDGANAVSNDHGRLYDIGDFDTGTTARTAAGNIDASAAALASKTVTTNQRLLIDWQFGPGVGRWDFRTNGADQDVTDTRTEADRETGSTVTSSRNDWFAATARGPITLSFNHAAYVGIQAHAFRFAQVELPLV